MKPKFVLPIFLFFLMAGCAAQTKRSEPPASQTQPTSAPSSSVKTATNDSKPNDKFNQNTSSRAESQTSEEETEIEKSLDKGEIASAVKLLDAKYGEKSVNDERAKHLQSLLLKAAHREALKSAQARNYKKAIEIMETAFQAAPLGITMVLYLKPERKDVKFVPTENDYKQYGFDKFLAWSEYVAIVNDYGFFLEQAGGTGYDVEVLQQVVKMSPQREAAHLNIADALWKRGNKQEAATEYKEYVTLMTAKGLAGNLPSRIKTRLP